LNGIWVGYMRGNGDWASYFVCCEELDRLGSLQFIEEFNRLDSQVPRVLCMVLRVNGHGYLRFRLLRTRKNVRSFGHCEDIVSLLPLEVIGQVDAIDEPKRSGSVSQVAYGDHYSIVSACHFKNSSTTRAPFRTSSNLGSVCVDFYRMFRSHKNHRNRGQSI
jgi:hypothetical protein